MSSPFFNHLIEGFGFPLAVHSKVTSISPSLTICGIGTVEKEGDAKFSGTPAFDLMFKLDLLLKAECDPDVALHWYVPLSEGISSSTSNEPDGNKSILELSYTSGESSLYQIISSFSLYEV